jgi:hypothetical protein
LISFISFIARGCRASGPRDDDVALLDVRGGAWLGGAVEGPDHRRLDPHEVRGRRGWDHGLRVPSARRGGRHRGRGRPFLAPAHGHAHPRVLDRDLSHARLLDDADELADALGPARLRRGGVGIVPAAAAADRVQERLGRLAEQGEQEQLLVAGGEPGRLLADLVEIDLVLWRRRIAGDKTDGPQDGLVDLGRRRAESPGGSRPARRRPSGSARPRGR